MLQAQVPADQLANPRANAQAFTVLVDCRHPWDGNDWTAGDGSSMSRESIFCAVRCGKSIERQARQRWNALDDDSARCHSPGRRCGNL